MVDKVGQDFGKFGDRSVARIQPLLRYDRVQSAKDGQRKAAQLCPVLVRDAQHERDDLGGQDHPEIGDQIQLALVFDLIQKAVHDAFDQRFHLGQFARRERPGDQLAHHRVIGRVIEDQRGGVMGVKRAFAKLFAKRLGLVRQHIARLIHLENVCMPGEVDRAIGIFVDRIMFPQPVQRGMWIFDK